MIRILVAIPLNVQASDRLSEIPEFEISVKPGLTPGQFMDEVRNADALVFSGFPPMSEKLLDAGSNLKLVITCGGRDSVDQGAAKRRGIEVRRVTPDRASGSRAVAILKDFFNV
jgi:phosphoglycerate dehydrogenase-like enzyme